VLLTHSLASLSIPSTASKSSCRGTSLLPWQPKSTRSPRAPERSEVLVSHEALWLGMGPPITWQRWAVSISSLIVFFSGVCYFASRHSLGHMAFASAMIFLLLAICYRIGEPPRWRFGDRD
jgi:hypothetical protein